MTRTYQPTKKPRPPVEDRETLLARYLAASEGEPVERRIRYLMAVMDINQATDAVVHMEAAAR